jgi:hypothetical protein
MQLTSVRQKLVFLSLVALLWGCSQGRQGTTAAQESVAAAAQDTAAPVAPAVAPTGRLSGALGTSTTNPVNANDAAAELTSSAVTATDGQRQFIRTAHAEFRVRDVYQSSLAIESIVAAHGGFVVKNDTGAETQSNQSRSEGNGKRIELSEYTTRGTMVVRVPSAKTQAFLLAIVGQVEFLDHRTFEAEDAQFELLRQQLASQRNQETQQEIGQAAEQGGKLDQKTDALQTRDQAKAARDEALVAQKEFEDKIAFSTIDLSMYQTPKIRATEMVDVEAEFARNTPGFFERFRISLQNGWQGLLDVLIGLAAVWPLWLVAALLWIVIRRFSRRLSAGPNVTPNAK